VKIWRKYTVHNILQRTESHRKHAPKIWWCSDTPLLRYATRQTYVQTCWVQYFTLLVGKDLLT